MAFLDSIRSIFGPVGVPQADSEAPAPPTTYSISPLTEKQSKEVLKLNLRCFRNGENYTKYTFAYLFNEPRSVSYQIETANGDMAAFAFVLLNPDGAAHLTTIGVAPEHRRRGLATRLLNHLDEVLRIKGVSMIVLELRVSNFEAKGLYIDAGYSLVNRLTKYYSDGEDCFLMVKSLV
jgi:ribosomal protein S18 acetylase RimI-like enzyme